MIYQGKEGLKWWTGVVEDRNDPLALNRVRVRIYGAHTWNKLLIATPDLPWSEVMMPTTSSSLSGLGQTIHGLVEGSTVMGFWRDGLNMQDPVVMGSFVGIPQSHYRIDETIDDAHVRNYTKVDRKTTDGFNDPRLGSESSYSGTPDGSNPKQMPSRTYGLTLALDKSPREQGGSSAINYPRENYIGSSDVNTLAAGDGEYNESAYPNNIITNSLATGEDRSEYVKPIYPFNHVYESESGHVIEIDDTPDNERVHVYHRSGARIEIAPNGEITVKSPAEDINLEAANVNVKSTGYVKIIAADDCKITAEGEANIVASKDVKVVSSGETKITALKDVIMKAVDKIKIQ